MDSYYQHSSAYQLQPPSTTEPTQPMDETYQYSYQYSSSSTMETPRWSGYYTYQPSSSPEEPPQSTELPSAYSYLDSSSSTAARAESSQNTDSPGIYCLHHGCTSEPFRREADLQRHYRNAHNPDSTKEANHRDDTWSLNTEIHHCLHPGCTARPFRRAADLQRHYKHTHSPDPNRDAYYCDYPRCTRAQEPFRRCDHFRDHLREYHREDIQKRGEVVNEEWLDGRYYSDNWWRCPRCLIRVYISKDDFECPKCKGSCEPKRKEKRRGH